MEPMCLGIRAVSIALSSEGLSATDLFARLTICVCRLVASGQCPLDLFAKLRSASAVVARRALLSLL